MPELAQTISSNGANVSLAPQADPQTVIDCKVDQLHYGNFLAVRDTHIPIIKKRITAFIGP